MSALGAINGIVGEFLCEQCREAGLLEGVQSVSFGLTDYGVQLWCNLHDANIIAIEFDLSTARLSNGFTLRNPHRD